MHIFFSRVWFWDTIIIIIICLLYVLSGVQVVISKSFFLEVCWGGAAFKAPPEQSCADLQTMLFLFLSTWVGAGESASSSSTVKLVITTTTTTPLLFFSPETEVAATLCPRCVVGESERTWTERGLDLCLYVAPPQCLSKSQLSFVRGHALPWHVPLSRMGRARSDGMGRTSVAHRCL